MKTLLLALVRWSIFFTIILVCNSCISEFVAEINEENELLVVEGLITDQPEIYTIKLSKSLPIGLKSEAKPYSGCTVTVYDNLDNRYRFTETDAGTYISPSFFQGIVGRTYKIRISSPAGELNYESYPLEMLPVAPIHQLNYQKTVIRDIEGDLYDIHGCQIYLNFYDQGSGSKYYRWEYFETWILRLLFSVKNQTCWVSDQSKSIHIKSTAAFEENSLVSHPVLFISNTTDRLSREYSILVNQYSMNEDEYNFWAALQNLTEQSGGLYDMIPASIPGNLKCLENPDESVLGYFSVSAKASKRIYIKDDFSGIINSYADCITDTVYGDLPIPGIDTTRWILFDIPAWFPNPRIRILTDTWGCSDCTERGTAIKPSFWRNE